MSANKNTAETPKELLIKTTDKVESILKENFPEFLTFDKGQYTIHRGSSQVMIIVRPFTEDETCVEFIANVVTGARLSENLLKFLLRKNAELHFGSFGLLFDNTITFSHTITGTNLDANEFITSLVSVAIIADHYDDKIVEMAGGKRASDINSEDF